MLEVAVVVEITLVFILLVILLAVVLIRIRQGDYGRQKGYPSPASLAMQELSYRTIPYADRDVRYGRMPGDMTMRGDPSSPVRRSPYYGSGVDPYGKGSGMGPSPDAFRPEYMPYGARREGAAYSGYPYGQDDAYAYGYRASGRGGYGSVRTDNMFERFPDERVVEADRYGEASGRMEYASPVIGREKTYHKAPRDKRKNGREDYAERMTLPSDMPGQDAGKRKNWNEFRPRWRVDFMEMSSGRHVKRDFQDRLIVGRQMPKEMESGKLYLSMDATVSRAQFCLFVTDEGVMIENLSKVNVTRKNGYPLWRPVRLDEGDILELGRMRYMVKEIRPAM